VPKVRKIPDRFSLHQLSFESVAPAFKAGMRRQR
jgi:hypothetical protein